MSEIFSESARLRGLQRAENLGGDNFLRERAELLMGERMADMRGEFGDILLHGHPRVALLPGWDAGRVRRLHILSGLWEVFPSSFDLVYSLLELHWSNDLSSDLLRYNLALRGGGLLQGCLVGGESLAFLRDCLLRAEVELCGGAGVRVSPFVAMDSLVGLLGSIGFGGVVVDREVLEVRYSDIYSLMVDLRQMGGGNYLLGRRGSFTRRGLFELAGEIYAKEYAMDGGIGVRFELLFFHGFSSGGN